MEIHPLGAELLHADGWADMTKLRVAFSNFAKSVKIDHLFHITKRHAINGVEGNNSFQALCKIAKSSVSLWPSAWNNSSPTGQISIKFDI